MMAMADETEISNTNESNTSSPLVFGHTGEDWDRWLLISLGLAALAAVAVVGTTAGSIISHKREAERAEADLATYKLTVEGKVADAKREGIEAGKTAGNAMVRAAQLEKETEAERLERLRLEAIIAPRSLSPQQQATITAGLKPFAGKEVSVTSYALDGEAALLTLQILSILRNAGIIPQDNVASLMPMGGFAFGVHVIGSDAALVSALRTLFSGIGKQAVAPPEVKDSFLSSGGALVDPAAKKPDAAILIGIKPIPKIK
jgi:hypothetical protein